MVAWPQTIPFNRFNEFNGLPGCTPCRLEQLGLADDMWRRWSALIRKWTKHDETHCSPMMSHAAPPSQKSSKRHRIWCHSPAFPPEMSQEICWIYCDPHTYLQNFADSSFVMFHAISNCRNNIYLCESSFAAQSQVWHPVVSYGPTVSLANSLRLPGTNWDKVQAFTVAAQLNESGSSASSACIASSRSNAT